MYTPKHFEESRTEVLQALIRAHPLATLVTLTADGIDANHIPLQVVPGATPYGTLIGHVARANPMLAQLLAGTEVLAVFQGPEAYISPSWYATKAEHGKVVPTWNYAVVHARGKLQVRDEPAWVRAQMASLTRQMEMQFERPWTIDDAPASFTEKLIDAVVGIEIPIMQLTGKWKVSQNQPLVNRQGVIDGLGPAHPMAGLVRPHG